MHYPVYYSDLRSREIVDSDPEIKKQLINLFGDEVYVGDKLNRPFLAEKIFSSDELRLKVNDIIHPKVRVDFKNWAAEQTSEFVFNEAALFMENGSYKKFEATILVIAPEELKIERVVKRDGLSPDQVKTRMLNQWTDEQKMPLTPYHILNDEHHPLLAQVEALIEKLKVSLYI